MPAWTTWKYWTQRKFRAKQNTKDYIYLHWDFRSSHQESPGEKEETYRTYDVVDNIEKTVYCDIQTWLHSQNQNRDTEIYCHCCQAFNKRQLSLSSVNSLESSSDCPQYLDISDDESLYSSILRRKSRDIFMTI